MDAELECMCTKRDRREGLSVRWMLTGATEASLAAAALWALARKREELVLELVALASCVHTYHPVSILDYGWIPVT